MRARVVVRLRFEFHSHTFLSDGELHPIEHIRRAHAAGHNFVALTDHVGIHDLERTVPVLARECEAAMEDWKITAWPGVEITHVPPRRIADVACRARKLGAKIVVVHGETPNEPVVHGTNAAAVQSADVDVLAHPGFLTRREAETAVKNGVFLEITARRGHNVANGHVARLIETLEAPFVVDADAHGPADFVTEERARVIASGAGLSSALVQKGLRDHPKTLVKRRQG